MWVSRYVFLFMIYSFMGWVYETMFCTIKGGKWENRGFLYGPGCPIYGIGAVTISVIMQLTVGNGIALRAWQVFLISVLGSAVLEYTTSWVLEKMFHAAWWDYSDWQDLFIRQSGIWCRRSADGLCHSAVHGKCSQLYSADRTGIPCAVIPLCVCGRPYAYRNDTASF